MTCPATAKHTGSTIRGRPLRRDGRKPGDPGRTQELPGTGFVHRSVGAVEFCHDPLDLVESFLDQRAVGWTAARTALAQRPDRRRRSSAATSVGAPTTITGTFRPACSCNERDAPGRACRCGSGSRHRRTPAPDRTRWGRRRPPRSAGAGFCSGLGSHQMAVEVDELAVEGGLVVRPDLTASQASVRASGASACGGSVPWLFSSSRFQPAPTPKSKRPPDR